MRHKKFYLELKLFSNYLILSLMSCLALVGCFGSSSDTTRDRDGDSAKPWVEMTIEYPGPHSKWAGPQNFTIQVSTLKLGDTRITLSPPLEDSSRETKSGQALSIEGAREEFARMSLAMHGREVVYHGCLLPVRVKLVRADGATIERQACRSQAGWPRIASEVANYFIEVALFTSRDKK